MTTSRYMSPCMNEDHQPIASSPFLNHVHHHPLAYPLNSRVQGMGCLGCLANQSGICMDGLVSFHWGIDRALTFLIKRQIHQPNPSLTPYPLLSFFRPENHHQGWLEPPDVDSPSTIATHLIAYCFVD